ncbi:uncharacterized protein A1O5_08245 [Cladophialophora psammophila CBS 110553]|uniref:Zinc finger PHD-type domain-containing protein n=1 Tax=Cladophialophora psammophila CBS 110553 TaxID=1182543 RepID=W9WKM2_9EURO|nr:uncharacterized protein A1O5_08245 [Cladophialophora psammophila CBS 110553]EXJ68453.1 hypothetical protein A1O5_08245 [Cladophialophora psammophila CBS 110553]
MSAPLPATVRMKDQDADFVYFCEDSCHTSYSGCIDGDSSMTEQEISEFIRHSNPSLYETLNSVGIASSYLPCDEDQEPIDPSGDKSHMSTEVIRETSGSLFYETGTIFDHATRSSDADCPSETDLTSDFNPGSRHAAEPVVLGRYHFTFYQHCEPGIVYCCSSPTCPNSANVIPEGEYFAMIRDEALSEGNGQLTDYERTSYYCLDCLDEVVDREQRPETMQKMVSQLVDGAQPDRNSILLRALQIYPTLEKKDSFFLRLCFEGESDLEPGNASNSKKVIRLRRQKQLEIQRIENDLEQQRFKAVYRIKKANPSGLRILVSPDTQPYRDRYKKQGLQWVDRLRQLKEARRIAGRPAARHTSASDHDSGDMLVCHCREPADEGPMLRCRSASCMFGSIHFRCSGLDRLPSETEYYWCDYCKSDFTGDTEKVCGTRMPEKCISKTENDLDVETGDGDLRGSIYGGGEVDNDDKGDIVSPSPGFVAVNHVVSKGK